MQQVLVQFGDVQVFLQRDLGSCTKLLSFSQMYTILQLELAVVIDWGQLFVKATYSLKGDGPLAVECYEIIETVGSAIRVSHTPNVQAISQKLSSGSDSMLHSIFHVSQNPPSRVVRGSASISSVSGSLQQRMLNYAKSCVQPGLDYFEKHLNSSLKDALSVFKAARYFSPKKVHAIQPDANETDALCVFPFLEVPTDIEGLKKELPAYFAKVIDLDPKV